MMNPFYDADRVKLSAEDKKLVGALYEDESAALAAEAWPPPEGQSLSGAP